MCHVGNVSNVHDLPHPRCYVVHRALQLTTRRMLDNGIGCDLICVVSPPLHMVRVCVRARVRVCVRVRGWHRCTPAFDYYLENACPLQVPLFMYTDQHHGARKTPKAEVYTLPRWLHTSFFGPGKARLQVRAAAIHTPLPLVVTFAARLLAVPFTSHPTSPGRSLTKTSSRLSCTRPSLEVRPRQAQLAYDAVPPNVAWSCVGLRQMTLHKGSCRCATRACSEMVCGWLHAEPSCPCL